MLRPLDAAADAEALFDASHGDPATESLWTYLFQSPFASASHMRTWLEEQEASTDPLFLTVLGPSDERRLGMVSFLNIDAAMRRLELGNIWYAPEAQRTRVNTESVYLLLRHAFDNLGYRRVEWKCDALNARSRKAALRLGFEFEGIFRQHMVIKGRNRDTSWYAMLDSEWPAVQDNMETWLYCGEGERLSLTELNAGLQESARQRSWRSS